MSAPSELWNDRIGAFARVVGRSPEEVSSILVKLVGSPDDEGAHLIADPTCASDDLLITAFPDVPRARLNRAIQDLRRSSAAVAEAPGRSLALPTPPDDDSFLQALKVGGTSLVAVTDINAALRAFLAWKLGLLDIPERLLAAMEAHALAQDRPVDPCFYDVTRLVLERRHGDILAAFGLGGSWVNPERRRQLFTRMEGVWVALGRLQERLSAWKQSAMDRVSGPAAMMNVITLMGRGVPAPTLPGLTDFPDLGPVRDAVEATVDAFNRIFAGTGVPVARALAADGLRVRALLADERLPPAVGATTREAMLKQLKIGVNADYVRLERDLTSYVLAVHEFARVPKDSAPFYAIALENLGEGIPWAALFAESARGGHQKF